MSNRSVFVSAVLFIVLFFQNSVAQPLNWRVAGIGGGGAFFRPSLDPGNDNEYYVPTDMGSFFHTLDFGASYSELSFRQIIGGSLGVVRFTKDPQILYAIGTVPSINKWSVTCYKSTDRGVTWSLPNGLKGQTSQALNATGVEVLTDFENPDRLIFGTQSGLFYSSDGGNNFRDIGNAFKAPAGVEIYPCGCLFDNDTIYIGTNYGVLMSRDAGVDWKVLNLTGIPSGENIFGFAAAKQNGSVRFFCITGTTNGVMNVDAVVTTAPGYPALLKGVYSLDYNAGTIWQPKESGISIPTDPNCACDHMTWIGMAHNDINAVYLYGVNNQGQPQVLKTSDAGMSWEHVFKIANNENIYTGYMGDKGDPFEWWLGCSGMSVAENNANKVVLSNMGSIYKTSSGGATWEQGYVLSADQNPMGQPTPRYKSYHGIGIENTTNWFVHWSSANDVLGCLTDIGSIRSTDGGTSWAFDQYPFNTMYCAIEHPTTHAIYCASSDKHDMYSSTALQDASIDDPSYSDGKVLISTDKGFTWSAIHDFTRPVYWIAFDPNNSNTMYASVVNHKQGVGGIWVTNNLQDGPASQWRQLPAPPRTEGHPAMIVPLKDGKIVCTFSGRMTDYSAKPTGKFTESSGVFLYDPQMNQWSDRTDTNTMEWYCNDIVVDPNDATENTWYVGVNSGWGYTDAAGKVGPNDQGGLFRTTDRGVHWTKLFGTSDVLSPGGGVFSCAFNPNDRNELYVTTSGDGLLVSKNARSEAPIFSPVLNFQFGYPLRALFDPYDENQLWVTTFGNGIHIGKLNAASVQASTRSGASILIYPNPSSIGFTIEADGTPVEVRNPLGQVMTTIPPRLGAVHVVTTDWPNGVYFLRSDKTATKVVIGH